MPAKTSHPSQEQLSAYNLGQLPPNEAVSIESHINECRPCCETIIGLSTEDTFVELLQEARQLPGVEGKQSTSASGQDGIPAALANHSRYQILGLIGKGGMGDVYKAQHRVMERTVALKIINRELIRKSDAVDRFHREVKTAAQLSHPNVVTAFDAEQAGDAHFLVMEYVDGVDLSRIVKERGTLPVAEACDYIRQAAIGLQHAHEQGMIHRDIKPHNLMVMSDGTLKILDFGLASLAPQTLADTKKDETRGDLTSVGVVMGTPDFISPEQANDARLADNRSDIYSLGATLYTLLSGQAPFADGSVMHKLNSHARAEPVPLSSLRDDIPAGLSTLVAKMMAKAPAERFQSSAEVADVLEEYVDSSHVISGQLTRKLTLGRVARWPFLAVATFLLATVLATTIFYVQSGQTTLRFEINDPQISVKFDDEMITVHTAGERSFRIQPLEEQNFAVYWNDTVVETDSLTTRRGDKVVLSIDVTDGEIEIDSNIQGTLPSRNRFLKESSQPVESEVLRKEFLEAIASMLTDGPMPETRQVGERVWDKLEEEIEDEIRSRRRHYPEFLKLTPSSERLLKTQQALPGTAKRITDARKQLGDMEIKLSDPTRQLVSLWLPLLEKSELSPLRSELLAQVLQSELLKHAAQAKTHTAEVSASRVDTIAALEQALKIYKLDCGHFPSTQQGLQALLKKPTDSDTAKNWRGPYLKHLPKDRWGNAYGYEFPSSLGGDKTQPAVWSCGPDGVAHTPDDIRRRDLQDLAVIEQMARIFDDWSKNPDTAERGATFSSQVEAQRQKLFKNRRANTEKHRQVSARVTQLCWRFLGNEIPNTMALKLVEWTKPSDGVRVSDRLATAGRPTEPLGWDVQATHALALARAGKTEAALQESRALATKIDVNLRKGRLPDLQLEFLGQMRSQNSLLKQMRLQEAIILALAGETSEAMDATTAAGQIKVERPAKDDQAAIQAMLRLFAKSHGQP